MDISNKNIVIATHYLVYGAPQALRDFLIEKKVKTFYFIAHPLQINDTKSYIEHILSGNIYSKREIKFRSKNNFINYIFESFLTFKECVFKKDKIDLYVGVDPLNAFIGVLLKLIGKVRKTIYYTIDYVPYRFSNKLLNNFYHWLDKVCVKYSDETWNVSHRIAEGREKIKGLSKIIYNKQRVVPIGVWFDKIERLPFDKIKNHQLLFIGNLLEKQGVQLVLDAIPQILKEINDFHFLIVGGGEYESVLKDKVEQMNLYKYVTFTGWIKDRNELDKIMKDSAVSIAMYDKEKDTFTYYADPTKLKDYLSAGIPILLTDLPHNAYEIQDKGCGIIVEYNVDSLVKAVIDMMYDKEKLAKYRLNCITYAKTFDWNIIFTSNLERVLG